MEKASYLHSLDFFFTRIAVGLHYWSTTVLSFFKARPGEGGVQFGFLRIREVCFPGWRQRCLKVLCTVLDLST
jgi:hypothetical protein